MKNFIRKSFKRKLLASFLAVALVPLAVSCIFLIQLFRVKAASDYKKIDMEQAEAVNEALSGLLETIGDMAETLSANPRIREAVGQEDPGGKSEVYNILYGATTALREQARFDIYSVDGVCLYSTGAGMYQKKQPPYWGILKVAAAHSEELVIRRTRDDGADPVVLQAARGILGEDETLAGFLVTDLTRKNLEEALKGICGSQDGICILDPYYETVFCMGTAARGDVGEALRAKAMEEGKLFSSWKGNSVYVSALGDTGLTSILLRPEVFSETTINGMYTVLFIMMALSAFLCIFMASKLSSNLSRPIWKMNMAIEEVRRGKLDSRVQTRHQDELGQLADNFNAMTERLSEYMTEQVAQQKKINDTQIAMMQAQLNPHFLYNTLDTMKWVAKANHIPEIATLAAKLAKILRTSISSSPFITLKEELELVESYAQIQTIRFGGRFSFTCDLPEELEKIRVPKLIVQPIVENAMIHGLADADEGSIAVRAFRSETDGCLFIEVTDDGCGISEEVLAHLNSRDRENLSGHIGFYNVDMVIRLHYGDGYGLRAERREEGGTRVTIVLPEAGERREEDV